jgi:K(+)-stimulated pyrophosphate-energized sodium pump
MKSRFLSSRLGRFASVIATLLLLGGGTAFAEPVAPVGGEANLQLPDLTQVRFLGHPGINGHSLLMYGPLFCFLGMLFGFVMYVHLKGLPVHRSMSDVSQLIWETCKTYLINQGKFLLLLWSFIAVVILAYFAVLLHFSASKVIIILGFSILGMAGSYFVAWFGIRVNTLANSRAAYASLGGNPYRAFNVPLKAGMSIGMMLISIELLLMFSIILFVPGSYAGPCFIGFAIGESLGAAVLRLAGGIFTKIADIGADLMKIVFHVKEDDARNPGVIADCTGDNAGDSVGPTADGFETYGVVQVALIAFIILGAKNAISGVQLLVWLFAVRVAMLVAAVAGYYINSIISKTRYSKAAEMNFEAPLTSLVWITSVVTIAVTYPITWLLLSQLGGDPTLWWKLATITSCGTVAGALIP